jgi:hypothetical protein
MKMTPPRTNLFIFNHLRRRTIKTMITARMAMPTLPQNGGDLLQLVERRRRSREKEILGGHVIA